MRVVVVTPPEPVVSLEEAKLRLRVDHDNDDELIEALVAAATQHVDGPTGWLGRAIGEQTLELRLDRFGSKAIGLPFRPIIGIDSVTYLDDSGADVDLAEGDGWRWSPGSHLLLPPYNQSWPSGRCDADAVRIRYRAGYNGEDFDAGGTGPVPEPIRTAIMLYAGVWYENREETLTGLTVAALPPHVGAEALLMTYRLWSV